MRRWILALLPLVPLGAQDLLIQGATLHTVSHGSLADTDLLIQGGRIKALGKGLKAPAGIRVLDGKGRHVMPGMVDAHAHFALEGNTNEMGLAVTSMASTASVLDPEDPALARRRADGVTTANILHGSANPIGGTNAVIKLRRSATAAGLLLEGAKPGIKFALGENPKRSNFNQQGPARYPGSRMGVMDVIRQAFTEARAYRKAWQDYEARKKEKGAVAPARDLRLEPLVEVLEGRRLVHAHCYRSDEILALLRLADEFGFRIATLQHALEAYKVAPEIARHGAGVSTFADRWGYKVEAFDAIPENAALCLRQGIVTSINSDYPVVPRLLNQEAARAWKYGRLSEAQALALVTLNPAKQLGLEARLGSLDQGKDGDVVVYDRHPLSIEAVAQQVIIEGQVLFDRAEDLAGRPALVAEKAALKEKLAKEGKPGAEAPAERPTGAEFGGGGMVLEGGLHREEAGSLVPGPWSLGTLSKSASVLVRNARIHPVSGPVIERGSILVEEGRLKAVGAEVAAPQGAEVIDAAGLDAYPGFMDAGGVLGLLEVPSVKATVDTSDPGTFLPQLQAATAIHFQSELIPISRVNGVTHALAVPGQGGGSLLPGQASAFRLGGHAFEDGGLKAAAALVVRWPQIRLQREGMGFGPGQPRPYAEAKEEQGRQVAELKAWFERGRRYLANPAADPDPALAALVPYLEGKAPVLLTSLRAKELREALAYLSGLRMRILVEAGEDILEAKEALVAAQAGVVVGPTLRFPRNEDLPYDHWQALPEVLRQAGLPIAFGSFGEPADVRSHPYEGPGNALAHGLTFEAALEALTLAPARMFGLDKDLGSLEPGKEATFFLVQGNPLDFSGDVKAVFIRGVRMPVEHRHRQLLERFGSRL